MSRTLNSRRVLVTLGTCTFFDIFALFRLRTMCPSELRVFALLLVGPSKSWYQQNHVSVCLYFNYFCPHFDSKCDDLSLRIKCLYNRFCEFWKLNLMIKTCLKISRHFLKTLSFSIFVMYCESKENTRSFWVLRCSQQVSSVSSYSNKIIFRDTNYYTKYYSTLRNHHPFPIILLPTYLCLLSKNQNKYLYL